MNPAMEKMEKIRHKVLDALHDKDMTQEDTRTLVDASTKLTHDVQLLSGGRTENVGHEEDRRILLGIVDALRLNDGST